ncbi:methylesterase 10-like [Tripterygium wilfordii]|uniref:Methylesterase 10-like n=2 Tax=Tripterygium wilfordii TaxID=458696 RepID=A0A7J7CVN3_TRIWF|nr:methylesterase 10-like [Tripterygium wilfordii]
MEGTEKPTTCMSFGPLFLARIYQNCLPEDLELAKMLVRPLGLFRLSDKDSVLTKGNFGSANRVFVVCGEDASINEEFQRWMIENSPPNEVKYISEAGHMVMLSKPEQLCQCLLEIVDNYQ